MARRAASRVRMQMPLVTANPVAAAEYFRITFDAIVPTLFGVPLHIRKTTPFHIDSRAGIFGHLTNFDANLEARQKGTLHFHGIATALLSPAVLSAVAHSPVFMKTVAAVFDSMICAAAPADRLLEQLVKERYDDVFFERPNYAAQIPPDTIGELEAVSHASAASTHTVMHRRHHADSCVRCGRRCCRYAKPSGLLECTGMRLITIREDAELTEHEPKPSRKDLRQEDFEVLAPTERPLHDYDQDPFQPLNARPLAFEMRRPAIQLTGAAGNAADLCDEDHLRLDIRECLESDGFMHVDACIKAKIRSLTDEEAQKVTELLFASNGFISEYNDLLMAAAHCNMAVYPMGTAASANSQFMYVCKYLCKERTDRDPVAAQHPLQRSKAYREVSLHGGGFRV
jgi:hypothetical protein